jgi:hypothetical protein
VNENFPETYEPTALELKARNRRNIAIALLLASFMAFVFITMITRAAGASG